MIKAIANLTKLLPLILVSAGVVILIVGGGQLERVTTLNAPASFNVTIYQVNIAYVVMKQEVEFKDNAAIIELPGSTIIETLRVISPEVWNWRLMAGETIPLIHEGDLITIRADGQVYAGRYLWTGDGYLLVETGVNKSVMIAISKIQSIELSRAIQISKPPRGIKVKLEGPHSGKIELTLGFLSRGLSWAAGSEMETDGGFFMTKAIISGYDNWTDIYVTLVLAEPRVIFSGPVRYDMAEKALTFAPSYTIKYTGPYYSFKLKEKLSISQGEQIILPLFSGEVEAIKYHLWEGSDPRYQPETSTPQLMINVTNNLEHPIPVGFVNFFSGNDWIGSDINPYIPRGSTATLTIGYSRDVIVHSTITSVDRLDSSIRYSVLLTVTNYGREIATIVLKQHLPSDATISMTSLSPISRGLLLIWSFTLDPGKTQAVSFMFEVPIYR